jgi:serine/threonine-protein phosphatase PGAM5
MSRPAALFLLTAIAWGLPLAGAAPPASPPPAAKGVHTLYLVRHGAYDSDDPRDAAVGKALLPIGVAQARLLGARLHGMPVAFTALLASPLTRARETATVIAEDLPGLSLTIVPELAECTPPTRRQDIMAEEKPADLAACRAQLEKVYTTYFTSTPEADRADLLVCHGNVIRYLVTKALAVDPEAWLGMSIGQASLTTIAIGPDGAPHVLAVGDVGHLPPRLQTGAYSNPERDLVVPTSAAAVARP